MPKTTCEIQVYEPIGMWGVSASGVADALKGEGDRVEVLINSPGGDILEGLAVFNLLRAETKKRPVRCTVMGVAASMASVIAMAGQEIVMWDNALLMIHNPRSFVDVLLSGAESDEVREAAASLQKQADLLDLLKGQLLAAYRRTGIPDDQLSALMDAETWLTADEALKKGFATKVIPPAAAPQARWGAAHLARYQHVPARARAALDPPRPISPPKRNTMPKDPKRISAALVAVSGLLELAQAGAQSDDQAEASAFAAIAQALPPIASTLQGLGVEEPQAKLTDLLALSAAVEEVTGQKAGQVGAVKALARNAAAAESLSARAQVAQVVAQMVQDGQIGPDERAHYEGLALVDVQAAQRILRKAAPPQKPIEGKGQIAGAAGAVTAESEAEARKLLGREKRS